MKKAINEQENDYKDVEEFLGSVGLMKYKDTFIDNGIEETEVILELNEQHLEAMRIPLGHKLKIMKRIKELQKDTADVSKVGAEAKMPTKSSLVKHSELEALPEPTGGVGVETSAQANMGSQGNSLMQGEFNEAQSHQYFLEALKEWRSGGATASGDNKENQVENSVGTSNERTKKEHHVRFSDEANEIKMINIESTVSEKKGFLYGAASGGNAWNLPEMPSQEEAGTKMSPRDDAKVIGVKESCW